jgi:16S rRNA (guanine966-N2)-methyltransferase
MLASIGCQPSMVLDLYAGSGALGIEAISRGALHADFVERSVAACATIRDNLNRLGYSQRGRVYCLPVDRSFGRLTGPYDLIFVDPPYADRSIEPTLSSSSATSLWREGTLLIYEHSRRDPPPERLGPLTLSQTRSHGTSSVSFYSASTDSYKGPMRD